MEAEEVLEAEVGGQEEIGKFAGRSHKTLEVEEDFQVIEERGETSSYKERRWSLNSFFNPTCVLFI